MTMLRITMVKEVSDYLTGDIVLDRDALDQLAAERFGAGVTFADLCADNSTENAVGIVEDLVDALGVADIEFRFSQSGETLGTSIENVQVDDQVVDE